MQVLVRGRVRRENASNVVCRFSLRLSLLALATTLGCSGTPDDAAPQDETFVEADETLLAELHLPYGDVRFSEYRSAESDPAILMTVSSSVKLGQTPLDRLIQEQGPLTALEVFMAIAPNDQVPASIVTSHALEAQRLGRPSSEALHVVLGTELTVPKFNLACRNFIWQDPGPQADVIDKLAREFADGANALPVVSGTFFTTSNVTLGLCNESVNFQTAFLRYCSRTRAAAGFTCTGRQFVQPGDGLRAYNFSEGNRNYKVLGESPDDHSLVTARMSANPR